MIYDFVMIFLTLFFNLLYIIVPFVMILRAVKKRSGTKERKTSSKKTDNIIDKLRYMETKEKNHSSVERKSYTSFEQNEYGFEMKHHNNGNDPFRMK